MPRDFQTELSAADISSQLFGLPNMSFKDRVVGAFRTQQIMLCTGGELLDRILSRGGKYSEDDAKEVMVQILSVVPNCHLQGVVHRDLKPENFLFTSKDEHSPLKAIDFGLSDYVKPDERLNDIVGSAYYVAPEVLHRSYGPEADMWSIGVIAYILLCGSRPLWPAQNLASFKLFLKQNQVSMKPLGLLCLLRQ